MASIYSGNNEYLGELQKVTPESKATPAAAQLLVSMDVARQAAKQTANQWRYAAVVLSGAVIYLGVRKWWR